MSSPMPLAIRTAQNWQVGRIALVVVGVFLAVNWTHGLIQFFDPTLEEYHIAAALRISGCVAFIAAVIAGGRPFWAIHVSLALVLVGSAFGIMISGGIYNQLPIMLLPVMVLFFIGFHASLVWYCACIAILVLVVAVDPWLPDIWVTQTWDGRTYTYSLFHRDDKLPIWFMPFLDTGIIVSAPYVLTLIFYREAVTANQRAQRLLENVLPRFVLDRLSGGRSIDYSAPAFRDSYDSATVLFVDIIGFTPLASRLGPEETVSLMNHVFAAFDEIAARHRIEKIKTIGDAYMAIGGIDQSDRLDHALRTVFAAKEITQFLDSNYFSGVGKLSVRIGIETGPVEGGVVGRSRFAFDVWGRTVNVAARLEAHAGINAILLGPGAASAVAGAITLEPIGERDLRGIGRLPAWQATP